MIDKQKVLESLVRSLGDRAAILSKDLNESHEKINAMEQAGKAAASEASGRIQVFFNQNKRLRLDSHQSRRIYQDCGLQSAFHILTVS